MRAFLAIDFSKGLKSEIAYLQKILKPHTCSGRWKYIDNFHLTLKFLDEIDLKTAAQISDKMRELCAVTGRFKLKISELGNFPGKDSLRVLWLGIDGDLDRLTSLQNEIDENLLKIGFQREKRGYTPHVTIGQDLVFNMGFDQIKELAGIDRFPEIPVEKVYMFKSEQIGNKRVYTPFNEFGLLGDKL